MPSDPSDPSDFNMLRQKKSAADDDSIHVGNDGLMRESMPSKSGVLGMLVPAMAGGKNEIDLTLMIASTVHFYPW